MADEWVATPEFESSPAETLIVPETPPEVLDRWEIERAVDRYHRSGNRRPFGGVDGFETPPPSEVVQESEFVPPVFDESETQPPSDGFDESQPPFQPYDDSETQAPSLPFDDSETQAPSLPFDYSETQAPSLPFDDSETQAPSLPFDDSETQPPSHPFADSEAQPPSSSKVEYTENQRAMLLILLPSMKDFL